MNIDSSKYPTIKVNAKYDNEFYRIVSLVSEFKLHVTYVYIEDHKPWGWTLWERVHSPDGYHHSWWARDGSENVRSDIGGVCNPDAHQLFDSAFETLTFQKEVLGG